MKVGIIISYFNCHSHTMYSNIRLLDCINQPKALIDKAIELGLSGIAITDHECLSAHMEVNQYAKTLREKHPNFTVALGNEIYLTDDRSTGQKYYHFILIAKDEIGHRALRELSSIAWSNSYVDRKMERVPTLKSELESVIHKYPGHLIATTACLGGELSTNVMNMALADEVGDTVNSTYYRIQIDEFIKYCVNLFGEDFYIECAPATSKDQVMVNKVLLKIATFYDIKLVTGTDAHYLRPENRLIHKAYLNAKDGEREIDSFYEFAYLMDSNEAKELLMSSFEEEYAEMVLTNSNELKEKIQFFSLERKQSIPRVELPHYDKLPYPIFKEWNTLNSLLMSDEIQERYWVNECINKLTQMNLMNEEYLSRLEIEADIIVDIGSKLDDCLFAYFNTFKHYIDLFWECGSIVGPGRGSATGFLSNYLLGITQLDPVRWNLPYWRFLNKERAELPEKYQYWAVVKKEH